MTLRHATVFTLGMTSLTLITDIISWITRFGYFDYFDLISWLYIIARVLWLVSLITFFGILLRNQVAKEKQSNE